MAGDPLPAWRLQVPGIAAHRGGREEGPENTLAGMLTGLTSGATHLEIDVRATADDIPVVIHDATTDRTCLEPGKVGDLTAKELAAYDPCALWSEFKGIATGDRDPPAGLTAGWFRIPTLDRVLRTFHGVPLMLDLKETAPVDSVANIIKRWGRTGDIALQGYDDDVLDAVAAKLPDVPRGAGFNGTRAFFEGEATPAQVICVPLVHDGIELVDEGFIQQAHEQDKAFWVWTINHRKKATELLAMGVDGIITDVPGKMSLLREAHLRGERVH